MAQQSRFCSLLISTNFPEAAIFFKYQLSMIVLAIVKEKNIVILSVGIQGKRNTKKAQTQNQARGHTFNMSVKN